MPNTHRGAAECHAALKLSSPVMAGVMLTRSNVPLLLLL